MEPDTRTADQKKLEKQYPDEDVRLAIKNFVIYFADKKEPFTIDDLEQAQLTDDEIMNDRIFNDLRIASSPLKDWITNETDLKISNVNEPEGRAVKAEKMFEE